MQQILHVQVAARTAQGTRRAENQDRFEILVGGQVLILADGFSGRPYGAVASRAAVEAVGAYFCDLGLDPERIRQLEPEVAERYLRTAFGLANEAVVRAAAPLGESIAASLLIGLLLDGQLVVAHVGDCRVYRLRHALLKQLTRDHRVCPPELDTLSTEEVDAVRPLVCVVERMLGGPVLPEVDVGMYRAGVGDTLLFCSNGLSDVLPLQSVTKILLAATDSEQACAHLIEAAKDFGAEDDMTALVVQWSAGIQSPRGEPVPIDGSGEIVGGTS